MKELEKINPIEINVKKEKEVQYDLIDKIIPYNNHTVWEIDIKTLLIKKAEYYNTNYIVGEENKKEIITKKGFKYVSALNEKNALKKYKKGITGSKEINPEPPSITGY